MSTPMIDALRVFGWTVFLGLWAIVARSDWQTQRIRHAHLLYGAAAACAGYLALAAHTAWGVLGRAHVYYYWGFYHAVATHAFLCVVAGLALWLLRVWPAGDAKLFALLGLLYPLVGGMTVPERLFLNMLINTFLPAAAFLFATAAWYVFETRVRAGREFLVGLGWQREAAFVAEVVRKRALELAAQLKESLTKARGAGLAEHAAWLGRKVRDLIPQLFQWLISAFFASLISYALKGLLESPVVLSLLCMALFFVWRRVRETLGTTGARLLLAGCTAALFWWKQPDLTKLGVLFGNITVFSFFVFLGMNGAMRVVLGGVQTAMIYVLPFIMMGFSLALTYVWQGVRRLWLFLYFTARDASMPAKVYGPSMFESAGTLSRLHLPFSLGPFAPYLPTMVALACLGTFFGLALVMVRLWDDEVRPSHRIKDLAPNLVLADSFVARLAADEEFYHGRLGTLYADGLTRDQAEAVREWCAANGVETVPLKPTVSFASFIFLGMFLSLLLKGAQLLQVVLS